MKRLLLTTLVFFLAVSVTFAANIQRVVDPKNQKEIWTMEVYNNDDSTMEPGDVVIWDIDASTGDDDNYVTITTTADTMLVAGVVYPSSIAVGGIGTIAFHGVVDVDYSSAQTVGDVVCTSSSEGVAADCTTGDFRGFGTVMEAADPGKTFIRIKN